MCVSENFDFGIFPNFITNLPFIEIVTVKVEFTNKQFFVSSIYRPPKTNFEIFNKFILNVVASEI